MIPNRREWVAGLWSLGAGAILIGCTRTAPTEANEGRKDNADDEPEVTATEDLMREHGVLRRALLVYQESAMKLRNAANVPPGPLQKTAKLFRGFGEEYHEKKLEEVYIFPAVKKAGRVAGGYSHILFAQHQPGREITDFIIAATAGPMPVADPTKPLATALEGLER